MGEVGQRQGISEYRAEIPSLYVRAEILRKHWSSSELWYLRDVVLDTCCYTAPHPPRLKAALGLPFIYLQIMSKLYV